MGKKILTISLAFLSVSLFSQVGIGTDNPKATLEIKHIQGTTSSGLLIPRLTMTEAKALRNVEHSTLIYITDFRGADVSGTVQMVDKPGYYYFTKNIDEFPDVQGENSSNSIEGLWHNVPNREEILDEVRRIDLTAYPKFFYMPSLLLPTVPNAEVNVYKIKNPQYPTNSTDEYLDIPSFTYDDTNKVFTVDLYKIFNSQFNFPVASSVTISSSNPNPLEGFVLTAEQYDYFVTYADMDTFNSITLSADGKLSYKVNPEKIIRNGSFMNIVLKVK